MKKRRKKQPMPSDEEVEDFLAKTPSFVIICDTCTVGYAMRITFEQFEKCLEDAQHDQSKALRAIIDIEKFDEFYAKNPKTMSQMATFCEEHLSHKWRRSAHHKIANPAELFEVFFKSRPIELTNVASLLFPDEPHLYPKTTTEIAKRLGLNEDKGSSKRVWQWYEKKNFPAIEQRTAAELRTVLEIYQGLRSELQARKREDEQAG